MLHIRGKGTGRNHKGWVPYKAEAPDWQKLWNTKKCHTAPTIGTAEKSNQITSLDLMHCSKFQLHQKAPPMASANSSRDSWDLWSIGWCRKWSGRGHQLGRRMSSNIGMYMAPAHRIQAHLEPFQPYQPCIDRCLTLWHHWEGAGPSFQVATQRNRKKVWYRIQMQGATVGNSVIPFFHP